MDTKRRLRVKLDLLAARCNKELKPVVWFIRKCTKPDQKEFLEVATRVAIGFGVMGGLAFFIKLVFIAIIF